MQPYQSLVLQSIHLGTFNNFLEFWTLLLLNSLTVTKNLRSRGTFSIRFHISLGKIIFIALPCKPYFPSVIIASHRATNSAKMGLTSIKCYIG